MLHQNDHLNCSLKPSVPLCSMSWGLLPRLWRPQLSRPLLRSAPLKATVGLTRISRRSFVRSDPVWVWVTISVPCVHRKIAQLVGCSKSIAELVVTHPHHSHHPLKWRRKTPFTRHDPQFLCTLVQHAKQENRTKSFRLQDIV